MDLFKDINKADMVLVLAVLLCAVAQGFVLAGWVWLLGL